MKSAMGMIGGQREADAKVCGLRGGRELITRIEIGMPSTCGAGCLAHNDKSAWCWMKETATKSWRRDLDESVSSLFLGPMNRLTISTRGALSTGRVPVGRGL